MKKFASMTRHNCAHWILMFGVLAGLFFSGGEGVRLLPFPIAECNNLKTTSSVLEKNLKSYALSVHNSGNYSPLFKSKSQKHTNQYLPGGHLTFHWSNIRGNFCLQPPINREETNLSHTSVYLSSQSDRAPPTI